MEDKIVLKEDQMDQVSGGGGVCDAGGRKCLQCGSTKVKLVNDSADFGRFKCEDCGCTFISDI